MINTGFNCIAGIDGLLFRHADMADLRVCEGDGGNKVIASPTPVLRFVVAEQVMGNYFRFVICFVTESGTTVYVAECPNSVNRSFKELIGLNEAALICFDSGVFHFERIGVGGNACGEHDFFGAYFQAVGKP